MRSHHRDDVQLPHSVESERILLGMAAAGYLSGAALRAIAFLEPLHFYIEAHRTIWQAIRTLEGTARDVHLVSIEELLRAWNAIGEGRALGSIADLTVLCNDIPATATPAQLALSIWRTAKRRADISHYTEALTVAYRGGDAEWQRERAQLAAEIASDPVDAPGKTAAAATAAATLLPIQSAEAVEALEPPAGLIGDILYENGVTILYADSGRWKTFLALGWACCVADGRPWLDRAVKGGHALYIAAEGGGAIGPRITAWKKRHGVATLPQLQVLTVPVNLLQPAHVTLLVASIRALIGDTLRLLVVDTLSRSMPGGNESSAEDGSAALAAADVLRQAFGCCVLILAHPGYNDTHIRGWSGYFQWVDGVIKAHASDRRPRIEPGDVLTLTCEKPKNSEGFAPIHLTAAVERWTVDEDSGATQSSLVIVAANACDAARTGERATPAAAAVQLPHSQRVVLSALATQPTITRAALVAYAAPYGIKKSAVYGAAHALLAAGWLSEDLAGLHITADCPNLSRFSSFGQNGNLGRLPVQFSTLSSVSIDTGKSGKPGSVVENDLDERRRRDSYTL